MSTDFKFSEKIEGENLIWTFEGVIDEEAKLPGLPSQPVKSVYLQLQAVKSINSVGIREWLNWIKPMAERFRIVLVNAPKALVLQMNMVEGFVPKGALVHSFYVPYFCESCDREENVLFTVGQEITAAAGSYIVKFDPKVAGLCEKGDCQMEMDASESKYFQFLKRL